jgi:predicted DCC family thiol-disulfide oxidoreductase YuxK
MISVFYDDRCPICSREIDYYKKISPSSVIKFCGISHHLNTLEKNKISYKESLKIIHAINKEGQIFRGVDAFVLIWQQFTGWRWFAKFVKLPVIYQVIKALYNIFANWRFNRLAHCKLDN